MNEIIFFLQIIVILGFSLAFRKRGAAALTAWISLQAIIANLFVLKQIQLFGLNVTASDAFVVGSLLSLNFIQEDHGVEEAKKCTRICFYMMLFFALASSFHLLFQPSPFDVSHSAFSTLLIPAPRIFLASLSVYFLVQQIDIRLFSYVKTRWPQLNFPLRSAFTLTISQLLDTALFSFAALYGTVESLIDIIAFSFMIKMLVISCCTTLIKWNRT